MIIRAAIVFSLIESLSINYSLRVSAICSLNPWWFDIPSNDIYICWPAWFGLTQSKAWSGVQVRVFGHDDVIKWNHFPGYWPFVRGIHRSPVNSPHNGQWRGALIFFLINAWINNWVNDREAANLRCHRAHYDATVMDAWRSANMMIFSVHPSLHVTQQSGLASKVKTNTRPTGEVSATAVTDLRGRIDVIQTPGLYNVKANQMPLDGKYTQLWICKMFQNHSKSSNWYIRGMQ